MSSVAAKPVSKRRTTSKETRQLQLIEATIRSIAKFGLSTTTMATWEKAFNECGDSVTEKIRALVRVDFEKLVCQRNKLAVRGAFAVRADLMAACGLTVLVRPSDRRDKGGIES